MNQVITIDGRGHAQQGNQDDAGLIADAAGDAVQGLAAEHQIRGDEAQVHDDHQGDHEDGAKGTELPAALNHLGYAELRALRRMQRHEDTAD